MKGDAAGKGNSSKSDGKDGGKNDGGKGDSKAAFKGTSKPMREGGALYVEPDRGGSKGGRGRRGGDDEPAVDAGGKGKGGKGKGGSSMPSNVSNARAQQQQQQGIRAGKGPSSTQTGRSSAATSAAVAGPENVPEAELVGPAPTHAKPAVARQANNVRALLLRTPVSEALAGPALFAEVMQARGTVPTRVMPTSTSTGKATGIPLVKRPSSLGGGGGSSSSGGLNAVLGTTPPVYLEDRPWETLAARTHGGRKGLLTDHLTARIADIGASIGMAAGALDASAVELANRILKERRAHLAAEGAKDSVQTDGSVV